MVVPALEVAPAGVDPGEVLLGELNCIACHPVEAAMRARLRPKEAPLLEGVGRRVQPAYLRAFLAQPHREKPGTTMPDMLQALPVAERRLAVDELTRFLVSMGGPARVEAVPVNDLMLRQGRVLYHRLGCVACHPPFESAAAIFGGGVAGGPTDPEAVRYVLNRLHQTSVPLGDLARKYSVSELARVLQDPVAVRAGGRMPSLNLNPDEAGALARYLLRDQALSEPGSMGVERRMAPVGFEAFALDGAQVERGRERFGALGCAACHALSVGGVRLESGLAARPLLSLSAEGEGGCLSATPAVGRPYFSLDAPQRQWLGRALGDRARWSAPVAGATAVAVAMARFNCYACHSRDGFGGPSASRSDFFTALGGTDLGDEGRIPPHLSGVGGKLRVAWMGEVLTNRGAVRAYMATRMPQYGPENVTWLAEAFAAADPAVPGGELLGQVAAEAEVGRELVGVGAYACVTCHRYGPHPALGSSVMDMTRMAGRLQVGWYRQYLLDPASLRPGTRMPTFWPEGEATIPTVLGGDAERQIAAIWAFLSLGAAGRPPPGLEPLLDAPDGR